MIRFDYIFMPLEFAPCATTAVVYYIGVWQRVEIVLVHVYFTIQHICSALSTHSNTHADVQNVPSIKQTAERGGSHALVKSVSPWGGYI